MGHIGRKTFLNAIRRNRYTEFGADDIHVIAVKKSAFLFGEDMDVLGAKDKLGDWRRSHRRSPDGAVTSALHEPTGVDHTPETDRLVLTSTDTVVKVCDKYCSDCMYGKR